MAKETPETALNEVTPAQESFEDLMGQLCCGSERAAWIIVERYAPHVLRVIRRSLPREIRSKVDSVDLLNTMFGSLLIKKTYLSRIREPAQLIALLTKAAQNRVIDEHRKYTAYASRNIRAEESTFDERSGSSDQQLGGTAGDGRFGGRELTPSQAAIAREKWTGLLATLDQRERVMVSLRMEGLTYRQIAERVDGISERTVRRVLNAVVARLLE